MRSRAGGHVSGEDVVRVAVQVLAGRVVPPSGARVGVPGGDLDVAEVGTRSSMVVTNVWRSMCGWVLAAWIPAVSAAGAGGGWPRAGPSGHRGC